MAEVLINEQHLIDMANAVRERGGSTEVYKPRELAAAINDTPNTLNSIFSRTITSYSNSTITTVCPSSFYLCKSLVSVDLPNVTYINSLGFAGCSGLTRLDFPNLTKTNTNAFNSCTNLTYINLPKITYLDHWTFSYCSSLVTVIIRTGTVCTLTSDAFNYTPIARGTGYIYVPAALVDTYKAATNWSTYAAQIRAIEDYPEICGEVA